MASSAKQQKLDGFFIKKQTNNGINTDLTQTVPTISDTNEEGPNEEVENEKIMNCSIVIQSKLLCNSQTSGFRRGFAGFPQKTL